MDTAKALSKIKLSLKRLPIYTYRYVWFIVPATILFIALVCGAVYSGSNVYGNFANVGIAFEGGTVLTVNITGGGSYADNAKITNNSTNGAVRVTGVEVTDGAYKVGDYNSFSGAKTIALKINGCATTGTGRLSSYTHASSSPAGTEAGWAFS